MSDTIFGTGLLKLNASRGRDPESERFSSSRLPAFTMSGLHGPGTTDVKLAELVVCEVLVVRVVRGDRESAGHETCRPRALEELDDKVRALRNPTNKLTGQIET